MNRNQSNRNSNSSEIFDELEYECLALRAYEALIIKEILEQILATYISASGEGEVACNSTTIVGTIILSHETLVAFYNIAEQPPKKVKGIAERSVMV